jgi:hypothetical protein
MLVEENIDASWRYMGDDDKYAWINSSYSCQTA